VGQQRPKPRNSTSDRGVGSRPSEPVSRRRSAGILGRTGWRNRHGSPGRRVRWSFDNGHGRRQSRRNTSRCCRKYGARPGPRGNSGGTNSGATRRPGRLQQGVSERVAPAGPRPGRPRRPREYRKLSTHQPLTAISPVYARVTGHTGAAGDDASVFEVAGNVARLYMSEVSRPAIRGVVPDTITSSHSKFARLRRESLRPELLVTPSPIRISQRPDY